MLRILTVEDEEFVASELTWLAALSQDAGIPVREPVSTLDGRLLTRVSTPGVPDGRIVTLMRWLGGQLLFEFLRFHYLTRLGTSTQPALAGCPIGTIGCNPAVFGGQLTLFTHKLLNFNARPGVTNP